MHVVDLAEGQEADSIFAVCHKWMSTRKDTPLHKRDSLLRKYLNDNVETEQGHMLFQVWNNLVMSKGLLYVSTTLKGEREGVLAFVVHATQHCTALNGVHHDAGHQGQQRTLALTQECFWWPLMADDCQALVRSCQHCCAFEGAIPKAPLCLIRAHMLLELIHINFTSVESMMELNKPPCIKNVLVVPDHFTRYALAVVTKRSDCEDHCQSAV